MNKPELSNQAFWDVDMDNIDYEKNAFFVLEQVIGWGKHQDFANIISFYGRDRIREEIVNTRKLGDKEVHFLCHLLGLQLSDFKNHKWGLLRSNVAVKNEFNEYYPRS